MTASTLLKTTKYSLSAEGQNGSGHLSGPDQNSAPPDVVWSVGKLKRSCLMVLAKNSSESRPGNAILEARQFLKA